MLWTDTYDTVILVININCECQLRALVIVSKKISA